MTHCHLGSRGTAHPRGRVSIRTSSFAPTRGYFPFGSKAGVIDVAEIVVSLGSLRFNLRVVWLQ
jgi:hypothetical protein